MASSGFHVLDYVLFGGTLVMSLAVGVYYTCSGGRQKTTQEFLLANKSLKPIPVAFSIFMSYISAILILGNTAEMYTAGIQYWLASIGSCLAFIFATIVFVPFFFNLNLTSSFEYFEARFQSKFVRLWASVMFMISSIVYMGLAMFTPATALEAVTGFPVWGSILAAGLVATFYTVLGGMKAVVWTDTIQGVILLLGILAVLIIGAIKVGGLDKVWQICADGGRLQLFDFNPDPTVRLTFWSVIFGRFFISLNYVGTGQTSIQRYSTLKSLKDAKLSALLNCPGIILVYTITCLCGLVVYAYYVEKGCDPISNQDISSPNQLLPFFIMEVINYPGIPGLFLAILFSGALSSISSSLNSMAACSWKDILEMRLNHISEGKKALINKLLVSVYGLMAVGMAFVAQGLGGHVLQATQSLVGGTGGPSQGLFILGSFFPWVNWQGALIGSMIGFGMSTWVSLGAYITKPSVGRLPLPSTENCTASPMVTEIYTEVFTADITTQTMGPDDTDDIFGLYKMSYMYSAAFGCLITIFTGLIITLITGPSDPKDQDPKLINPIVERLCCCLPSALRRRCWCGVQHDDLYDAEDPSPDEKYDLKYSDKDELTNGHSKPLYQDKEGSKTSEHAFEVPNDQGDGTFNSKSELLKSDRNTDVTVL